MKNILVALSFLFTSIICLAPASHAQESRPNILLIVVDDMGYSDIRPFGGKVCRVSDRTR